ncbi:GFA family protein [Ciceribacter sp. L1K22]|uniref:GFA family protein n=1 Tax=Ciceribacter sp. L1K22 TaxID=2820275 RepID=UPI001ABEA628|nr:GFA family protein [Ciceribacter sp. L1K22]MBO3760546.1 GFA family protein [Ciceribacter sp. L1K22]
MTDENSITHGACRCGQVRLKVQGKPLMTMACHCKGCQRMTASAFSLSALFPEASVEITGLDPVIGGMHGELKHNFCPHCLSWIFTRADMLGPLINIRSSMLDHTAEIAPFIETCAAEKLPWVTVPVRHSYEQFPPMEAFPALLAEFAETSR